MQRARAGRHRGGARGGSWSGSRAEREEHWWKGCTCPGEQAVALFAQPLLSPYQACSALSQHLTKHWPWAHLASGVLCPVSPLTPVAGSQHRGFWWRMDGSTLQPGRSGGRHYTTLLCGLRQIRVVSPRLRFPVGGRGERGRRAVGLNWAIKFIACVEMSPLLWAETKTQLQQSPPRVTKVASGVCLLATKRCWVFRWIKGLGGTGRDPLPWAEAGIRPVEGSGAPLAYNKGRVDCTTSEPSAPSCVVAAPHAMGVASGCTSGQRKGG